MIVLSDACSEPQFVMMRLMEHYDDQKGRCLGVALTHWQRGISLSSFSPEELATKQRDDLISAVFLESGTVPQDSELIL